MDPIKVASVCDCPTPKSVTKVLSFMGFVNFYWCFIQYLLYVANILHQLTKRGEAWRWAKDKQKASEELKWLIMSTPILVQPDQDSHFWLEMDASEYSTRAIMSQLCKDDKWHPLGFMSKCLSNAERN